MYNILQSQYTTTIVIRVTITVRARATWKLAGQGWAVN